MALPVSRLRRWFAVAGIALTMLVAGMYFYARWRVRGALKELPNKLGVNIEQTATDFTISKSEQGRTIFVVRASKAVQFKQGGKATLHNVNIILYGKDSSRFDQISGSDFEYDPQTGIVAANGDVQIDLEANPQGILRPDQAAPKELKNPLHLRTRGLVFNKNTGNAYTDDAIEFQVPQAQGSARGLEYVANTRVLTLKSNIAITLTGTHPARFTATRAEISNAPRRALLFAPRIVHGGDQFQSERATLFFRDDNTVDRILASGDVLADSKGNTPLHARADNAEIHWNAPANEVETAILSGNLRVVASGAHSMQADAGRAELFFQHKNRLERIHASEGVKLAQAAASSAAPASPLQNSIPAGSTQNVELTSAAMDFFVAGGQLLKRAVTAGPGQILISQPSDNRRTVVSAGKFDAQFGPRNQIASLHGAPDAMIADEVPGQPRRTSSSDVLDVAFHPGGGIDAITQEGRLAYSDGERKAWASRARYTPTDQMLTLTGEPRIEDAGFTVTSQTLRVSRATGDAIAEGDVKSTYSQLKPQNGAMLASGDPIHVTSSRVVAHRNPGSAIYTGNAKLWQNSSVVEASSIEFNRERRSLIADAKGQTVSTVLFQIDRQGRAKPVTVTSARLTYTDSERRIHLEGGVTARAEDMTITARNAEVFLAGVGSPAAGNPTGESAVAGRVDHIVAEGNVVIQQAKRRATGEKLVYTAEGEKFVLSGGTPSIFDAERGKISADSLTFFRPDDRVLVEGRSNSPAVTTTRVAR